MYDKQLIRGVIVNTIGLVAKLLHPLFFVVLTWLFGTNLVGLYFVAFFIIQFATSTATAGYNDAATIFASGAADDPEREDELYQMLANAFVVSLGIGVFVVGLTYAGVDAFVSRVYPNRPMLVPALKILAWTVPLYALSQTSIAATKARMKMEYETGIEGIARPLLLLGFSLIVYFAGGKFIGLMWAQLATQAVVTVAALWGFTRHFSVARTMSAVTHLRFDWAMFRFALPQSLNMTFNRFLTRLDVLMLAAFNFSNHVVAFYSAASLITSNLREVRLLFSAALNPIMVRHHVRGDRDALQFELGRVSRWTTSLIAPLVLILLAVRGDILLLIDKGFTGDTLFVAVLLIGPYANCAFGLAGNAIVCTKHSMWNLVNSFFVAGANALLNWILIPKYGLMGAAIATSAAAVLIAALTLVELQLLERVTIPAKAVFKPHLAMAAALAVAAVFWDPGTADGIASRSGIAVAMLAAYVAVLIVSRHEELVGWYRKRLAKTPARSRE